MPWTDPSGQTPATIKDAEVIFANIITFAVAFIGFLLFIMILLGGIKYLLSSGDPKAIKAAQNTIFYAIAGVVLFILSFVILKAIEQITGVPLLIFKIPTF